MALTKVSTPAIKDEAITLAKLLHGDSNSNGKFLRANNGTDPTFETVNTDLVSDSSPQLGGDLDTNSHNISLDDDHAVKFGGSEDLTISHRSSDESAVIKNFNDTGFLRLLSGDSNSSGILLKNRDDDVTYLRAKNEQGVELFYANVTKLETTNTGIEVTGRITTDSLSIQDDGSNEPLLHLRADDANPWAFLISNDNYHSGTTQGLKWYVANNGNAYQHLQGNGTFEEFHLQQSNGGGTTNTGIKLNTSRAVELNYQGSKKYETTSDGSTQYGNLTIPDNDAKIILKDGNNYIQFLNTDKEFKFMNAWGAGEFTFYPGGTERVRINPNGLLFNGDTASANALDDYEEGTYSPALGANGNISGGNGLGCTYTSQVGYYVKIGSFVFCNGMLVWNAKSGTLSNTTINLTLSIPFAMGGTGNQGAGQLSYNSAIDFNADCRNVHGVGSNAFIYFERVSTGSGKHTGYVKTQNLDSSGQINFAFSYRML